MVRVSCLVIAAGIALIAGNIEASAAVQQSPIPGYVCMDLNITDAQAHDFHFEVPIRSAADSKSQVIQTAAGTFAMRSPRHEVSGFVEVLTANRSIGWIASQYVRAHFAPLNPKSKCFPVLSATGRVMFSYSDS